MHSIYETPEMYAWCRSFGYDDYIMVHGHAKAKYGLTCNPLSEKIYQMLGDVFHAQMVETFEREEEQHAEERSALSWGMACSWLESFGAARSGKDSRGLEEAGSTLEGV